MKMDPKGKYQAFPVVKMASRDWPNNQITTSPIWCSVDLRDGNQSLVVPMTVAQKLQFFETLVKCGFKEIEVGFPAASPTEFAFVRRLIEDGRIPDDVTIQVLVQAREDLIVRTVESLVGAKRVIIHVYNSTSPAQRRIVFRKTKPEIVALAVQGIEWVKKHSARLVGTEVVLEYSPESFSATEVEFALEVCEAVIDVWQPTSEHKIILNLPATVETATPNVYADQIEWFCTHLRWRDVAIISLHTHNDRGTGVAATELGLLAGADRVEGTLFGNGERTGNLDIITVALNLYTQGIDPELDFSGLDSIREVYERCTGMTVPPRQPYSGELVFTAFSGSHQDAIDKALKALGTVWEVPYLTIDPKDIGRSYTEVIRVNGQSGKGGIGYLLEQEKGLRLPKEMLKEFGAIAGPLIDRLGREVTADDLTKMLWAEYVEQTGRYRLESFRSLDNTTTGCSVSAVLSIDGKNIELAEVAGNGPVDAFVRLLRERNVIDIQVISQSEHSLGAGAEATAISYVQIQFPNGIKRFGVGVDDSIPLASIRAIISALNRE